mgnify:CR=1 FL=1
MKNWDAENERYLDAKRAQNMCGKKRKFKSNEASRKANKFDQRKYLCPVCGHWHLTSDRSK